MVGKDVAHAVACAVAPQREHHALAGRLQAVDVGLDRLEHVGAGLRALYDFFHPVIRQVDSSGRVLVLGTPPEQSGSPGQAVAQRALEGFVRAVGKEVGNKGATANLLYAAPGAEAIVTPPG